MKIIDLYPKGTYSVVISTMNIPWSQTQISFPSLQISLYSFTNSSFINSSNHISQYAAKIFKWEYKAISELIWSETFIHLADCYNALLKLWPSQNQFNGRFWTKGYLFTIKNRRYVHILFIDILHREITVWCKSNWWNTFGIQGVHGWICCF